MNAQARGDGERNVDRDTSSTSTPGGPQDVVRLDLPLHHRHASTVRVVAASLAADLGFSVDEIEDPKRHIQLTGDDIKLLNPNTRTCPIFRTRRDAEITKAIYRRVPVLLKDGDLNGNPWARSADECATSRRTAVAWRPHQEYRSF